jgi:DNA-binding CsgD family transcriptional regulator
MGRRGDELATPVPIGRRGAIEAVRAGLGAGGSVLLYGPAGIGKSTVLHAVAQAVMAESRVLRAAAAEAEADLPYLALVDLFGAAIAEVASALPAQLRGALDAALLRSAAPATPQDQLAVRLAVLEVLRLLATRQPVLIVLDDVQWVDEPSAGVLSFVARRLDSVAVQVLAAERVPEDAHPCGRDLCPEPCMELALPPMASADVTELLRARFRDALPLTALLRASAASGGNPLYAVELGRVLARPDSSGGGLRPDGEPAANGLDPLPVPGRLRQLLSERLAALPDASTAALLIVAAAARPTYALVARLSQPGGESVVAGLSAAEHAGVVALDVGGAVRFTHPMLREMVYSDATPQARRAVHEQLAEVADDPVEGARHLALARPSPDADLATALMKAAAVAQQRGAPGAAADLAKLAADRTPPDEPGLAANRRLAAAAHAYAAGRPDAATAYVHAALRDADSPVTRVKARLLLVDLAEQDYSGVGPLLDAALADAGEDPALLARVHVLRAVKAHYDADPTAAIAEIDLAEAAAEAGGDIESGVEALCLRGVFEARVTGRSTDDLVERANRRSLGLALTTPVVVARQRGAMTKLFQGEVAEAVRRIETLRAGVEGSGTVRDLATVLISATSILVRAGRCAEALQAGRYCAQLFRDAVSTVGPGLVAGAIAELNGGDPERAARFAAEALEASQAAGDHDFALIAHVLLGQVQAQRGDPAGAVDLMRRGYVAEQRFGLRDPAVVPWHADFVEALVAVGSRAEAAEVLADVHANAKRCGRSVVELSLARAEASLTAAEDGPRAGAEALTEALRRWAGHPYPLDEARGWHALAILQRRAHRRGAAREALVEAIGRYTTAGAEPWRTVAVDDLARLDGARGPGLSDTERRIVELVRAGATNREIAASVFLSVKAVEANLTRLYRRLGVRNRAQLARVLPGGPPSLRA